MTDGMFDVVIPIFAIVGLGYAFSKKALFGPEVAAGLTRFMFYFAVPAMLFKSIATTELPNHIPWNFWLAFYVPSFIVFFIAMLTTRSLFGWRSAESGIAGVCAAYSNMVLLGLPLLLAAYGERVNLPLFMLLAPQSLLLFPTTIFAVEVFGGEKRGLDSLKLSLIGKLFLNPIILALVLGLIANLSGLVIAKIPLSILELISAAAPACALTALGASLAQYEFKGIHAASYTLAFLKLVMHPILVFLMCRVLGIEGFWMQVAVFLAAMPCGINAFIFASNYKLKAEIVTQSIVLSTLLSVITSATLLKLFASTM
ncbi:MAG: AEC family transporter [Pseudomonadota bacterium]